jgi:hypothetical protein
VICPICRRPSTEGQHGACVVSLSDFYRFQVAQLQHEIDRLRDQLIDAGVTRKGQL